MYQIWYGVHIWYDDVYTPVKPSPQSRWVLLLIGLLILRSTHDVIFTACSFLLLISIPSVPWYTSLFFHSSTGECWIVSSLGLLQRKLPWTFMRLCVDICFHFSWINTWDWDRWIIWEACVSCWDMAKPCPMVTHGAPTSSGSKLELLHVLTYVSEAGLFILAVPKGSPETLLCFSFVSNDSSGSSLPYAYVFAEGSVQVFRPFSCWGLIIAFWEFFICFGHKSLSDMWFANTFFWPVACLFVLLTVSWKVQVKFFYIVSLSVFSLMDLPLVLLPKKSLLNAQSQRFFPRSCIVLSFTFFRPMTISS